MWQIFPLLVSAAQQLLSRLASIVVPSKKAYRSAAERNLAHMRALRRVYIFAFVVSSVSHIASLALSFASIIVPAIFKPSIVAALHPAQVFIPSSPIAAPPAKSLGDGFHTFLMFDGIIGLTATLVWAIVLNRNAHGSHPIGASGWASLLVKVTGLTLVAGPAGAAIALVWGRDELVLEEGEGGVTDHSKKSI
ncbi:MAG: hypothetical protein M1832_006169 [Thelocarpon impressellum]|nr:MAG: hypothetical protein M1832_006169 [Thelocarpon impressellum]